MKTIYKILLTILSLIVLVTTWILYINYLINSSILNLIIISVITTILIYLISNIVLPKNKKGTKLLTLIIIIINISLLLLTPPLITKLDKNCTLTNSCTEEITEDNLYTFDQVKRKAKLDESLIKDSKKGTYTKIFNKNEIVDVHININRTNWTYLLDHAIEKPTVMANSITIGNYTLNYPSIKTKGLSTLNEVWESNNDRYSFTINFGKYLNDKNGYKEDQNLLGLNKISFNNMLGDPTYMKEYLSYYLLTEMGLDTPEYALSNLYINNQYHGLYFMIEPIDKALSLRTLKEKSKFMFKIEVPGGDLIYNQELDKYLNDKGEFDFSEILYDEKGNLIYPKDNILSRYNGIWENDEENFKDVVDMLPTFFKNLKKLNELSNTENKNTKEYEQELSKIIDVDKLLRYWAANIYLVNSDSYMTCIPVNYVIYMNEDGFMTIMPWDYNFSFGASQIDSVADIVNTNIYDPTEKTTLTDRPLLNVILSNDNYKEKYEQYLKDAVIIATDGGTTSDNKTYPKDNFKDMLNSHKDTIIAHQEQDFQSFYTSEEITTATTNLTQLIALRSEAVNNQLNNNFTRIKTNMSLHSMGGLEAVLHLKWNRQKYR